MKYAQPDRDRFRDAIDQRTDGDGHAGNVAQTDRRRQRRSQRLEVRDVSFMRRIVVASHHHVPAVLELPDLDEGDLLYMPTTLPGLSITKAREILQQTDRIIATVPEVERVFGKIGRAETATDPAPLSMIETTITLKPESEWRDGMTMEKLIDELDKAIQYPGLTNAWTMPIKTRIDMLSTGIKTPVGIKVGGPDLNVLEQIAKEIEAVVSAVAGARGAHFGRGPVMGDVKVGLALLGVALGHEIPAVYGLAGEVPITVGIDVPLDLDVVLTFIH